MKLGVVVRGLAVVTVGALCLVTTVSAKTDSKRIKRGEYLVNIAACNDCHTPMGSDGRPIMQYKMAGHPAEAPAAAYQGGPLGTFALTNTSWGGPWGISFTRNLTPDPNTGLGKWTEEDFIKAIRTGVNPAGRVLLPPMPWPQYAYMTDADLKAVWAYLRTLKPVNNPVPANLPPPPAGTK